MAKRGERDVWRSDGLGDGGFCRSDEYESDSPGLLPFDDLRVSMIGGYDAETIHSSKDHKVPSPSTVNQVYISPEFWFP